LLIYVVLTLQIESVVSYTDTAPTPTHLVTLKHLHFLKLLLCLRVGVVSAVCVPSVFRRYQFLLHYMFAMDNTKEINLFF